MQVKIGNRVISKWASINVSLRYDAVASPYSLSIYFNPANPDDRATFVPGRYLKTEIEHNGETLIVGTSINQSFKSSPTEQLMSFSGYTRSGVIEDCTMEPNMNTQFDKMSIADIVRTVLKPFNLQLEVSNVAGDANSTYPTAPIVEPDQTIKEFISTLTKGSNLVLSHNAQGDLLITRANTAQEPIYFFNGSTPVTSMELTFNGQPLHNYIWAVGQSNQDTTNASQSQSAGLVDQSRGNGALVNPYVLSSAYYVKTVPFDAGYRPAVYLQKTGDANTTPLTSRQCLSTELRNIRLTIEIEGWELNGKIVRPNSIVTVQNPSLFLYQTSRWFVEQVDLKGDNVAETATLHCVLPECFTQGDVVNVFTGNNLTVPFGEGGAHAVITPYV